MARKNRVADDKTVVGTKPKKKEFQFHTLCARIRELKDEISDLRTIGERKRLQVEHLAERLEAEQRDRRILTEAYRDSFSQERAELLARVMRLDLRLKGLVPNCDKSRTMTPESDRG